MDTVEQASKQLKAKEWLTYFEVKTRDNGDTFYTLAENRPEELMEMVREAHDGMMPDDYKYEYVHNALQAIVDYDDIENIQDEIEPDVYNGDLIKWLGSNLGRAAYVDQAVTDFGIEAKDFDLFKVIGYGQYIERVEVFNIVRGYIEQ